MLLTPDQTRLWKRWLIALSCGAYRQGRGRLRTPGGAFCCLGVACDVLDPDRWVRISPFESGSRMPMDGPSWYWGSESDQSAAATHFSVLPRDVIDAYGFTSPQGFQVNRQMFEELAIPERWHVDCGTLSGVNDTMPPDDFHTVRRVIALHLDRIASPVRAL